MSRPARLSILWRNLVHRRRVERDLDDEVRAYVDLLAAEKVGQGMSEAEARRAALVEAGGVEPVKEQVRDMRRGALAEGVAQDVRHAVRGLARDPLFAGAAVLALALGIGATTAVFSVVNAVLLRPLAYADPERLVVVLHRGTDPVTPANFLEWRRQASALTRMAAAESWSPNLSGVDEPETVKGLRITAGLLPMLGVRPLLGRTFPEAAETPGQERVVVLGHSLWQRRFGADPGVVGRSVVLDGEPHVVVGIMPSGFAFPPFWAPGAELWSPLAFGDGAANRRAQSLRVFARMAPGAALDGARAEMAAIAARLEREDPGTNRDVVVRPLEDAVVGNVRPSLRVLLGAVGFVLLIACANVAHMLLARAAGRHREVALRAALGATRGRLIRQFLTESVVLALAGGVGGILLALASVRLLVALAPANIPRIDSVAVDGPVLAFAAGMSLLTGPLFGLAPAVRASAWEVSEALKEGARATTEGRGRHRLRSLLVASEFALALVLSAGAGLMIRSFLALQAIDPGFDPHGVLTLVVSVAGAEAGAPGRRAAFYQELVRRVRALPGVRSASAVNHLPLAGDLWGMRFHVEGRPLPRPGERARAAYRVVLPGYFETMRIPIVRGRAVGEADRFDAPGVVVVNEWLAERHWPHENPVGKRLTFDDPSRNPTWLTVVGVARNAVRGEWAAPPEEELFVPFLQTRAYLERASTGFAYLTLAVRASGDPAALASPIRRVVASLDRGAPVSQVQTMDEVVAAATAAPRFHLLLLGAFAGLALLLAALGIYGVMSYTVSRRTNEIGIRMALGARPADVRWLIVGQGMAVVLAGAAAGLVGALALTRLMSSLLYGVGASDPATFLAVSLVLGAVALAASYLPARRATRIDPLAALRCE
jgi:putative ABC transport system permease protein